MNIVVTIKQVEDPATPPSHMVLGASGKSVQSVSGVPRIMNGYDANAVEAALQLKEQHGGKVTVVSLGDSSARTTLKRAIAMGADSCVLLSDPQWELLDSFGTASVLAAAVRKIGNVDLVLCGRQASDSDAGQVLYWLAEMLELPVASPIVKIEESSADALVVHSLLEEEYQRLSVKLPALLGISSEINEPRQPSPKGTVTATRTMVPTWNASSLAVGPLVCKVDMTKLELQIRTGKADLIEGADGAARGRALADKLHQLELL